MVHGRQQKKLSALGKLRGSPMVTFRFCKKEAIQKAKDNYCGWGCIPWSSYRHVKAASQQKHCQKTNSSWCGSYTCFFLLIFFCWRVTPPKTNMTGWKITYMFLLIRDTESTLKWLGFFRCHVYFVGELPSLKLTFLLKNGWLEYDAASF